MTVGRTERGAGLRWPAGLERLESVVMGVPFAKAVLGAISISLRISALQSLSSVTSHDIHHGGGGKKRDLSLPNPRRVPVIEKSGVSNVLPAYTAASAHAVVEVDAGRTRGVETTVRVMVLSYRADDSMNVEVSP